MRCVPVFILLVILFSSSVSAVWYLDSEYVTIDLKIDSGLHVSRIGPDFAMEYLTANISLVPLSLPGQDVLQLVIDPKPKVNDENYLFRWDSPVPSDPSFSIDAKVKRRQFFTRVGKTSFPYDDYPEDIVAYTQPAKTIDSDSPGIIAKSSELAAGETDYYRVVFKMADWTKSNVRYDLSSLTKKASQKASWVLENKEGVCDEITTLFISLLRAAGIPARFVSGIAYTESPQFPERWGPHGWAEVYFPDAGWVPFDVTYGEFGFVDPAHIILKYSRDAGESDIRYLWLGKDSEIFPAPINVSAVLTSQSGSVLEPVSLKLSMEQSLVGIGSYDLAVLEIENHLDAYVSLQVFLASIAEMEIISPKGQSVLLEPISTSKVFWLVKVTDDLDTRFTYTFPMTAATMKNLSASSSFAIVPGSSVFARQDFQRMIDAAEAEERAVYSKVVDLSCSSDKDVYYSYDVPLLYCAVKNRGNFPFKALRFCFDTGCSSDDLLISQERNFTHVVSSPVPGAGKIAFSVSGDGLSKSHFFDFTVLDVPNISITDIVYPAELEFDTPYRASFTVDRSSVSVPQNVSVYFSGADMERTIDVGSIEGPKEYVFDMDSGDLSLKPNRFNIGVVYYDSNGRMYTAGDDFDISLVNVTFGQKVVVWTKGADRWLRGLFD